MALSDEEVQSKRDHVEELREEVAELTRADQAKAEEKANDLVGRQLDSEADALEARIAYLKSVSEANASAGGEPEVKSVTPPVSNGLSGSDDDDDQ